MPTQAIAELEHLLDAWQTTGEQLLAAAHDLRAQLEAATPRGRPALPAGNAQHVQAAPPPPTWTQQPPAPAKNPASDPGQGAGGQPDGRGDVDLPKAQRAILTALAQHGRRSTTQVALLTGYSSKSGGYRNALSALRSAGLIEGRGDLTATAAGLQARPLRAAPHRPRTPRLVEGRPPRQSRAGHRRRPRRELPRPGRDPGDRRPDRLLGHQRRLPQRPLPATIPRARDRPRRAPAEPHPAPVTPAHDHDGGDPPGPPPELGDWITTDEAAALAHGAPDTLRHYQGEGEVWCATASRRHRLSAGPDRRVATR